MQYMTRLFLKYLFTFSLLLVLGSQQLYAYGLNSKKYSPKETTQDHRTEDFDNTRESLSSSFPSKPKQQHVLGEEKVEEEEKRTSDEDNVFENEYVAISLAHNFSALSILVLVKEQLSSHPHFLYSFSYKRYLRFEVFII
jgi:hypothetical protein